MRHAWQIVCWLRSWSKSESNWVIFFWESACNVICNCCIAMCYLKVHCAFNAACGLTCNCCLAADKDDLRADREDFMNCMTKKTFFDLLLWPSSDLKYEVFEIDSMCNAVCDAVDNCCLAAEGVGVKVGRKDWAEVIVECAFFCLLFWPFSWSRICVVGLRSDLQWSDLRSAMQHAVAVWE